MRYGLKGLDGELLVTAIAKITVTPIRRNADTIQKSFFIIIETSGKSKIFQNDYNHNLIDSRTLIVVMNFACLKMLGNFQFASSFKKQ